MKILLAVILMVLPTISFTNDKLIPSQSGPSSSSKQLFAKQQCDTVLVVFDIIKQYEEKMLFTGEAMTIIANGQPVKGVMMFFTNQETGSWSMISQYPDGMACLISNGLGFEPYSGINPEYNKFLNKEGEL